MQIDLPWGTGAQDVIKEHNTVLWWAALAVIDNQDDEQDPAAFRIGCLLVPDALRALDVPIMGAVLRRVVDTLREQLAPSLPAVELAA